MTRGDPPPPPIFPYMVQWIIKVDVLALNPSITENMTVPNSLLF